MHEEEQVEVPLEVLASSPESLRSSLFVCHPVDILFSVNGTAAAVVSPIAVCNVGAAAASEPPVGIGAGGERWGGCVRRY